MSRPLVSQVFGKAKDYRHELALGLRVCLYEEYLAATHHLRKDQGRISTFHLYGKTVPRQPDKEHRRIVAGTITRILPGNFSCEVEWDNGQKGTYFQKVLYMGDDVPAREETNYKMLLESRRVLEQRPDLRKKRAAAAAASATRQQPGGQDAQARADSAQRWSRWRPN